MLAPLRPLNTPPPLTMYKYIKAIKILYKY